MTNTPKNKAFKFLDLCAGVGGFHQAMKRLGGVCIGASEIDEACIETYKKNFPETPMLGDLNKIIASKIGDFQVLCAGFPCQPFSKAGKRLGFKDEARGKLFFKIMEILRHHPEVEFLILENVRNLADQKEYWETIRQQLHALDFVITENPLILSPSDFAIPQVRERVFILGVRRTTLDARKLRSRDITKESLKLRLDSCSPTQALTILDEEVDEKYYVDEERQQMLLAWDEFRERTGISVIGFPIWLSAMGIDSEDTMASVTKLPSLRTASARIPIFTKRIQCRGSVFPPCALSLGESSANSGATSSSPSSPISSNRVCNLSFA